MFLPPMPPMPSPAVFMASSSSQGGSYASVEVRTTINAGEGGTSSVYIQTNDNGRVQTEQYAKPLPPGGEVNISISTSTGGAAARTFVHAGASSSAATSTRPGRAGAFFFFSFTSWFFGWFGF